MLSSICDGFVRATIVIAGLDVVLVKECAVLVNVAVGVNSAAIELLRNVVPICLAVALCSIADVLEVAAVVFFGLDIMFIEVSGVLVSIAVVVISAVVELIDVGTVFGVCSVVLVIFSALVGAAVMLIGVAVVLLGIVVVLIEPGIVSGKCSVVVVKFLLLIKAAVVLVGITVEPNRGTVVFVGVSDVLVGAAVELVRLDGVLIEVCAVLVSVAVVDNIAAVEFFGDIVVLV